MAAFQVIIEVGTGKKLNVKLTDHMDSTIPHLQLRLKQ